MKNRFLKLCSMVLVIVLLTNMLPMSSFAEEFRESLTAMQEETDETVDTSSVEIVEEITEKRTQYTKEFLLSNGLHMAAVYPDAVHYETENGWAEIDNTLKITADGTYTNTAGVWNVRFPQQLSGAKNIVIEKDGYTLSFAMAGELRSSGEVMSTKATAAVEQFSVGAMQQAAAQINALDMATYKQSFQYEEMAPIKNRSRLTYADIYQNTDVIYDLDSNRVKESIVMDAYSSTLRGYRYTLNVGAMIPVLEEDGSITFYDPSRENIVMVMPAPYLVDAAEEFNDDIEVQLTGKDSTYILTYLLPQSWLAEESRQWPVILDPVITASTLKTNIKDVTVSEGKTYDNNWGMLQCGHSETYGLSRFYLKYENLPALKSSDVVVAASLSIYKHVDGNDIEVDVHKVNTTWTAKGMVWSNRPAYNTTVEDYAIVGAEGYYTWDITDAVRDWYASDNTGVMFKLPDNLENTTSHNIKQFRSVDYGVNRPTLAICFRNNNGLESYWDYTSSSAGRAGTGYVNNFTGNLVFTRDDLGFGGNRMPVSISHIYNANDADNNSFGMGLGWRTNFNQLVYQWPTDTDYYVWEDSDGTDHYFKLDSGSTYKDEDGLELTLTTNGSGTEKYCITDKDGNKSFFDTYGRLTKLQNNQQTKSSITVTYTTTSGKLISTVTDGAGRVYSFTYPNSLLDRVGYKGNGTKELSYVTFGYTGSRLTSVTDKDGKVCNYGYDTAGQLSSAKDIDGYKLNYTYHSVGDGTWQPYRVAKISESDGSSAGGELTISYAHNQTTFTDHNNNVEIHQFNDFGNTVSIQDDEGHAQFSQYNKNDYDAETGKANQLRLSSKMQNTVGNRMKYSSFENGEEWSVYPSGTSCENVTTHAYHGTRSLLFTATEWSCIMSEYLDIAPGETYTFSAYVKGVSGRSYILFVNRNTMESQMVDATGGETDWRRVEVSYTNTSSSVIKGCAQFYGVAGTQVYFDCAQVEKAPMASRYNLIENGDFRFTTTGWTKNGFSITSASKAAAPELQTAMVKAVGSATAQKNISQSVKVSGSAGDTFTVSGWARGDSVPIGAYDSRARKFGIEATVHYTDGNSKTVTANFNHDVGSDTQWQYAAQVLVAEKAYSSITVKLVYDYNANTVYFDGIQLYKEQFGNNYTYDEKGNVISVKDLQKQTTTYEYNTAMTDLLKIKQSGQTKMTYTYDSYHNVKTATTGEGLTYKFTYDAYGNNTSVSVSSGGSTMTSTATYSSDGNRLESTTDALGKVTTYHYNANTNVLEWVQYPEDTEATRTEYTYDNMCRLASAACTTDTGADMNAAYTYTDDLLTKIQTPSTTYNFTYGDFGLRTGVSIGNRVLATYTYTDNKNRYLSTLDYSEGYQVQYAYDKKGRVVKETFREFGIDKSSVTYTYDNNGVLAKVKDSATGITTTYYYDSTDRLMKYKESSTDHNFSMDYTMDTKNRVTQMYEVMNGYDRTSWYTYDDDSRIATYQKGWDKKAYSYDDFGRVESEAVTYQGTSMLTTEYTFTGASSQVAAMHSTAPSGFDRTYSYTYDDNGNILSVSDGTNTTSYVYDSANQLIRENNQAGGFTYFWEYDNAGNIRNRVEFAYTTGELDDALAIVEYGYFDTQWGDLLTSYNGHAITSDGLGNMQTDGTWTYMWENGRELASMSNGTDTWTYTYDANGMRIKRTNGTDTYTYMYYNGQLLNMSVGENDLYFTYDPNGTPMAVVYNDTVYYYLTNLQGDVVGIMDRACTQVVNYTYDAWGNILSVTGTMAATLGIINPLRYRGYVYDQETSLYYLQSRYYNPEMGRFISADKFVSTGQGFVGNNMLAYCGNNPVCCADPTGEAFGVIIGLIAIVGLIVCIPSSENQIPKQIAAAEEKYNENTINFSVNEIGTEEDKLNITFYPDAGLIHIEDSWSISSKYEKEAVISEIMDSEYYDSTLYGNSKETMLKEWSGHNFVYRTAKASPIIYDFYRSRGYEDPLKSTRGVDFRRELATSSRRNYDLVTLWGIIQW